MKEEQFIKIAKELGFDVYESDCDNEEYCMEAGGIVIYIPPKKKA